MSTVEKGNQAESTVADLYVKSGYEILERNFRCHKMGEIDIIAYKNSTIIFIEVKCRKPSDFSRPSEAVNMLKMNKIRSVANYYITIHQNEEKISNSDIRFDVAEVTDEGKKYIINVIKNAF